MEVAAAVVAALEAAAAAVAAAAAAAAAAAELGQERCLRHSRGARAACRPGAERDMLLAEFYGAGIEDSAILPLPDVVWGGGRCQQPEVTAADQEW